MTTAKEASIRYCVNACGARTRSPMKPAIVYPDGPDKPGTDLCEALVCPVVCGCRGVSARRLHADGGLRMRARCGHVRRVVEPFGPSEAQQHEVAVRFIGVEVPLHPAHEGGGIVPGYVARANGGLGPVGVDH